MSIAYVRMSLAATIVRAMLVVFTGTSFGEASIAQPLSEPIIVDLRTEGRPSDFYELGASRDEPKCRSALARLREPWSVPEEAILVDPVFFLGSGAGVEWERRASIYVRRNGSSSTNDRDRETVTLDLFATGSPVEVHRLRGSPHGVEQHSLLVIQNRASETHDSGRNPDGLRVYRWREGEPAIENRAKFTIGTVKRMPAELENASIVQELRLGGLYVYFNLMRIDGSIFVALMAARSARFNPNDVRVFLLKPHAIDDFEFLCEFKSRYTVP